MGTTDSLHLLHQSSASSSEGGRFHSGGRWAAVRHSDPCQVSNESVRSPEARRFRDRFVVGLQQYNGTKSSVSLSFSSVALLLQVGQRQSSSLSPPCAPG